MHLIHPILFIDLLNQSSYKNTILLSMMHKQLTYFSKKYSKLNRITLHKYESNKLFVVCKKDNIKVMKYVSKSVDVSIYKKFMFRCVVLKNNKILRYYVNCGYDVKMHEVVDYYCSTNLLSYACKLGHVKIVELLFGRYAGCNNGITVLDYASYHGNIDVVKLVKNKYMNFNRALEYSAENGHTKVVKYLLKCGANVNTRNNFALRHSAYGGYLEVVKLLLEAGADIHKIYMDIVPPNVKEYLEEKLKLI